MNNDDIFNEELKEELKKMARNFYLLERKLGKTGENQINDCLKKALSDFEKILADTGTEVKIEVSNEMLKKIEFELATQFNQDLSEKSIVLSGNNVQRGWLESLDKERLKFNYYDAYREFLQQIGRSAKVIEENEKIIDSILDLSGDPLQTGQWSRRGLVMGNVQSGKTQNYLGLINKAADLGYKMIIILGGHQNELRDQTQLRINEGFIGHDNSNGQKEIGVGAIRDINEYGVHEGTSIESDFNQRAARTFKFHVPGTTIPIIFCVKKNVSILNTLYEWIKNKHKLDPENNNRLKLPILFIDDEADYATPNTRQKYLDITATNEKIRNILNLFDRNTYVGYSATPFANIFIDPNNKDAMLGENLFPKDFLIRTPVPDNYCGQDFFFIKNEEKDQQSSPIIILENEAIKDHEEKLILISGQKKEMALDVKELPLKLKESVRTFFISTAVRFVRGDDKEHHSMIVNVSFLNDVNKETKKLLESYVEEIKNAIEATEGNPPREALASNIINEINDTFLSNFDIEEQWHDIFPMLEAVARKIKTFHLGSSGDKLDYEAFKANGLVCIVVGGHKLSRGVTFEGLSVTYFARNSKMYDTLMQMCRWFGYRDNYQDLCKVFMPKQSFNWYSHIARAINDLYIDLEEMERQYKTPENFGLKIRSHPDSLLITARLKMHTAKERIHKIDLWGQRQNRYRWKIDFDHKECLHITENLIKSFDENTSINKSTFHNDSSKIIYDNVDHDDVINFIQEMNMTPDHLGDQALIRHIKKMKNILGQFKFRVLFFTNKKKTNTWFTRVLEERGDQPMYSYDFLGQEIFLPQRTVDTDGKIIESPNSNLGDPADEKLFLSKDEIERINSEYKNNNKSDNVSNRYYLNSTERNFPVLIIYPFNLILMKPWNTRGNFLRGDGDLENYTQFPYIGYSISFPYLKEEHFGKTSSEIKDIHKNTQSSYTYNKVGQQEMDFDYGFDALLDEEDEYE